MSWITLGLAIWFVIAIAVSLFVGPFIHFGNPTDEVPLEDTRVPEFEQETIAQ